MTDIRVEAGAEKWVKFAKSRLDVLTNLRKSICLPVMRKYYAPESGVLISLRSADTGDFIEIRGGVSNPFYAVVRQDFTYRTVKDSTGLLSTTASPWLSTTRYPPNTVPYGFIEPGPLSSIVPPAYALNHALSLDVVAATPYGTLYIDKAFYNYDINPTSAGSNAHDYYELFSSDAPLKALTQYKAANLDYAVKKPPDNVPVITNTSAYLSTSTFAGALTSVAVLLRLPSGYAGPARHLMPSDGGIAYPYMYYLYDTVTATESNMGIMWAIISPQGVVSYAQQPYVRYNSYGGTGFYPGGLLNMTPGDTVFFINKTAYATVGGIAAVGSYIADEQIRIHSPAGQVFYIDSIYKAVERTDLVDRSFYFLMGAYYSRSPGDTHVLVGASDAIIVPPTDPSATFGVLKPGVSYPPPLRLFVDGVPKMIAIATGPDYGVSAVSSPSGYPSRTAWFGHGAINDAGVYCFTGIGYALSGTTVFRNIFSVFGDVLVEKVSVYSIPFTYSAFAVGESQLHANVTADGVMTTIQPSNTPAFSLWLTVAEGPTVLLEQGFNTTWTQQIHRVDLFLLSDTVDSAGIRIRKFKMMFIIDRTTGGKDFFEHEITLATSEGVLVAKKSGMTTDPTAPTVALTQDYRVPADIRQPNVGLAVLKTKYALITP